LHKSLHRRQNDVINTVPINTVLTSWGVKLLRVDSLNRDKRFVRIEDQIEQKTCLKPLWLLWSVLLFRRDLEIDLFQTYPVISVIVHFLIIKTVLVDAAWKESHKGRTRNNNTLKTRKTKCQNLVHSDRV